MQTDSDNRRQQPLSAITVEPMTEIDVPVVVELWTAQYQAARQRCPALPVSWLTETSALAAFLTERTVAGRGLVARAGAEVAGYLLYDTFAFHGEQVALCPIIGHAARASQHLASYTALYEHAATRWIEAGILTHFLMYFTHDQPLQQLLFELGFGLYVLDAYRPVELLPPMPRPAVECTIVRAGMEQADAVARLDAAACDYFRQSPRFLRREARRDGDIERMLTSDSAAYFLAYHGQNAVGILGVHLSQNDYGDFINLVDRHTGVLEFVYLQPEYRNHGMGRELLRHALQWCLERRLHSLHVDYESANRAASAFWPKAFTPVRSSVRRRVNQDSCEQG